MLNPLLQPEVKSFQDKFGNLLALFLKSGETLSPSRFKQENLAAQRLIKLYPDFDFFFNLPDLTNKFNSLWGMNTIYYRSELKKRYDYYIKNKKTDYNNLTDSPLKIEEIKEKPKNILEFIRQHEK